VVEVKVKISKGEQKLKGRTMTKVKINMYQRKGLIALSGKHKVKSISKILGVLYNEKQRNCHSSFILESFLQKHWKFLSMHLCKIVFE
jgi:hypothetical protein